MSVPGQIVSASSNIQAAMAMIVDYLDSTYSLQAADTLLEQGITNEEAKTVQDFEAKMNSATGPDNYIYQLKQPGADVSRLTSQYQDANMQNQALTKVMDGNNSTAQNTLSQNSQGQQGLMQTMSAINQQQANLARNIQG